MRFHPNQHLRQSSQRQSGREQHLPVMSPSAITNGYVNGNTNAHQHAPSNGHQAEALNLSIVGIGVEYPPYRVGPEALQTLADRYYPKSPAYVRLSSTTSFPLSSAHTHLIHFQCYLYLNSL